MQRRTFLSTFGLMPLLLFLPKMAWALVWNKQAFETTQIDLALQALGVSNVKPSDQIYIKAPDRAENGAIVQIEVKSGLANTESISILVQHNPTPLIATFQFSDETEGFVVTRIKMAETSEVLIVVKAAGQYYQNSKQVVVLENGCG
jgi:sulfur-oxidizing protein SoxY